MSIAIENQIIFDEENYTKVNYDSVPCYEPIGSYVSGEDSCEYYYYVYNDDPFIENDYNNPNYESNAFDIVLYDYEYVQKNDYLEFKLSVEYKYHEGGTKSGTYEVTYPESDLIIDVTINGSETQQIASNDPFNGTNRYDIYEFKFDDFDYDLDQEVIEIKIELSSELGYYEEYKISIDLTDESSTYHMFSVVDVKEQNSTSIEYGDYTLVVEPSDDLVNQQPQEIDYIAKLTLLDDNGDDIFMDHYVEDSLTVEIKDQNDKYVSSSGEFFINCELVENENSWLIVPDDNLYYNVETDQIGFTKELDIQYEYYYYFTDTIPSTLKDPNQIKYFEISFILKDNYEKYIITIPFGYDEAFAQDDSIERGDYNAGIDQLHSEEYTIEVIYG